MNDVDVQIYEAGAAGYRDAAQYDEVRYVGPANEYKQRVMEKTYLAMLGPLQGLRVLDVGCGTGRGIAEFAKTADFAAGVDASPAMLSNAEAKLKGRTNYELLNGYAQQLPFENASFDVVTTLNFLHLFRPATQREMIAEMKRVVKPGGILLLEFDNALQGLVFGIIKRWLKRETGSFPSDIATAIGDGCEIVDVRGAVFPVWWRATYRVPSVGETLAKLAWFPPFNRLAHRIYYKVRKT